MGREGRHLLLDCTRTYRLVFIPMLCIWVALSLVSLNTLQTGATLASTLGSFDIESNVLLPTRALRKEPDAVCDHNSICSFLQANNQGVNVVEYCRCQGPTKCSIKWDPYDGKSITQAQSDQYKYCQSAPTVPTCSSVSEIAYTSLRVYHGEIKVHSRDSIHCICPDGHNYLDSKYEFREVGEVTEVLVDYYCLPLQRCNMTEFCKEVTVKPGKYVVSPKCLCSDGLACPSVAKKGVERTPIGSGELHRIKCQDPISGVGHFSDLYVSRTLPGLFRKRNSLKKRTLDNRRTIKDLETYQASMGEDSLGYHGPRVDDRLTGLWNN